MTSKERFIRDFKTAHKAYPYIKGRILEEWPEYPYYVEGDFPIIDSEGTDWGTYSATIHFHKTYPKGFALLKDRSKIFPWNLDWHMDEKSGLCCVCSPLKNIEKSMTKISVLEFIQDYTLPFYANQVYKKQFGRYKNGEYAHHNEGRWQALEEEFDTKDRNEIRRILRSMPKRRRRKDPCFCGSGRPFNKCHQHRIRYLEVIASHMNLA